MARSAFFALPERNSPVRELAECVHASYDAPVPTYHCPICHKTLAAERKEDAPFRPFCSRRCKLIDLGRWLDGTYTISEDLPARPGDETPDTQSSE